MRGVLGLLLCAVALAAFAANAAAQTLPPTLSGEFFSDQDVQMISGTCNSNGTSTITYYTSGVATGPYAGT